MHGNFTVLLISFFNAIFIIFFFNSKKILNYCNSYIGRYDEENNVVQHETDKILQKLVNIENDINEVQKQQAEIQNIVESKYQKEYELIIKKQFKTEIDKKNTEIALEEKKRKLEKANKEIDIIFDKLKEKFKNNKDNFHNKLI